MSAVVHERYDAHPQVPDACVHKPPEPRILRIPGDISRANDHRVKQRNLEIVIPGVLIQFPQDERGNLLSRMRVRHHSIAFRKRRVGSAHPTIVPISSSLNSAVSGK